MPEKDHTPLFAHLEDETDPRSFSAPSKRCDTCQIVKPLDDFTRIHRNRDGRSGRCKPCNNALRSRGAVPPPDYVPPEFKRCTSCGTDKPLAEYPPNRRNWDGRQSHCRPCCNAERRAYGIRPEVRVKLKVIEIRSKLKSRYGISVAEYDRLFEAQAGKCALCDKPPLGCGKSVRLHVDHDHANGAIRGLLCHKCNSALAAFGDDLEGIMKVVAYLRRTS
jgi:hypothetical protein